MSEVIKEILDENLIESSHINHIYNVFCKICEPHSLEISPSSFKQFLNAQKDFKNYTLDNDLVNLMFMKMNFSDNGTVNFSDFLNFIYTNLKFLFSHKGLTYEASNSSNIRKFNFKLKPLLSNSESKNFYSLIYFLLIKANDVIFQRELLYRNSNFYYLFKLFSNEASFKGLLKNSFNYQMQESDSLICINAGNTDVTNNLALIFSFLNNSNSLAEFYSNCNLNTFDLNSSKSFEDSLRYLNSIAIPFLDIISHFDLAQPLYFNLVFKSLQVLFSVNYVEKIIAAFSNLNISSGNQQILIGLISSYLSKIFNLANFFLSLFSTYKNNPVLGKIVNDYFKENEITILEFSKLYDEIIILVIEQNNRLIQETIISLNDGSLFKNSSYDYYEDNNINIEVIYEYIHNLILLNITISQYKIAAFDIIFKNNQSTLILIEHSSRILLSNSLNNSKKNSYTNYLENDECTYNLSEKEIYLLRRFCFLTVKMVWTMFDYSVTFPSILGTNDSMNNTSILFQIQKVTSSWYHYYFSDTDLVFQIYFFILCSILTKKIVLKDKEIINKFQLLIKNKILGSLNTYDSYFVCTSHCFYIKNLLLNKMKKESILILNETQSIDFIRKNYMYPNNNFFNSLLSNDEEDYFSSEYFEILNLFYTENHLISNVLICPQILTDFMNVSELIIFKLANFYSNKIKTKIFDILLKILESSTDIITTENFLLSQSKLLDFVIRIISNTSNIDNLFIYELDLNSIISSAHERIFDVELIEKIIHITFIIFTSNFDIPTYDNSNNSINTSSISNFSIIDIPDKFKSNFLGNGGVYVNPGLIKLFNIYGNRLISLPTVEKLMKLFEIINDLKTNTVIIDSVNEVSAKSLQNHNSGHQNYGNNNKLAQKYHNLMTKHILENYPYYFSYTANNYSNSDSKKNNINSSIINNNKMSLSGKFSKSTYHTPKKEDDISISLNSMSFIDRDGFNSGKKENLSIKGYLNNEESEIVDVIISILKKKNHNILLINDSYDFYKYEYVSNTNFLLAIIIIIRNIYQMSLLLFKNYSGNCPFYDELEPILLLIKEKLPILEKKYKHLISEQDSDYEINLEGFVISTLTQEDENTKHTIMHYFKKDDDISYLSIKNKIEKSYNKGELELFSKSLDEVKDKVNYIKIKSDDDFLKCLEENINNCKKMRMKEVQVEILVVPDKSKNHKFIFNCQNCFSDYYLNESDMKTDGKGTVQILQQNNLCNSCKDLILNNYTKSMNNLSYIMPNESIINSDGIQYIRANNSLIPINSPLNMTKLPILNNLNNTYIIPNRLNNTRMDNLNRTNPNIVIPNRTKLNFNDSQIGYPNLNTTNHINNNIGSNYSLKDEDTLLNLNKVLNSNQYQQKINPNISNFTTDNHKILDLSGISNRTNITTIFDNNKVPDEQYTQYKLK